MFLEYARRGISIFACYPNKKPATDHGFYDATADEEKLKTQFFNDNLFIGLPTGKLNGLVVIDFDVKEGFGVDELVEMLEEYGPLPDTFKVSTPSGGRHYYYFDPETELSSHTRFFHEKIPCDLRANNGYAIAPGSPGYEPYDDYSDNFLDDFYKKISPLPEWVKNHRREREQTALVEMDIPVTEIREIRSALNYIDADSRDNWVNVGMALKNLSSDTVARGLWDEWSQRSTKYNPKDQEAKWKTFKPKDITIASIFHMAKQAGWETTYSQPIVVTDNLPPKKEITNVKASYTFPEELFHPGGLVQDILEYIIEMSVRPQPVYALAAALAACGALMGRKYQTPTKLRTNLYCLCIGPSGSGKEAPRKAIKILFEAAGCGHRASVENLASDTAIENNLAGDDCQSQVYLLDEIGRFLQTTNNSRNAHLANVVSVLLKLYNSSDGQYRGKIFADTDKGVRINQPNLCLYGTTVPETLYDGLTKENITDGVISRMMMFETDVSRPRRNKKLHTGPPPVEIIDQIKAINARPLNHNPQGNLDDINPNPITVFYTDEAENMLNDFEEEIEKERDKIAAQGGYEAVYNRTVQIAEQVALIVSVSKNIDNPIIDEESFRYGSVLAKHLADHMYFIAENYIAGNNTENEVKKIYQLIKHHGRVSIAELAKKTQHLFGSARNDIIETLKMSRQIKELRSGVDNESIMFYDAEYFDDYIKKME